MLKSDQQGFLIGEVLDVSKEMLSGQRAGLEVLSRIDANVSAMLGRAGRASRYRRSETSPMFPSAPVVEPAPRRSGPIIRPYGPVTATVPVAMQRDSKGRFIKGSGGSTQPDGGAGGNPNPKEKPAPDEGRSSGENRIVEAIKETAAQSTDRMDPMIEAAKEVWEPLGRGWRASFGQAAEKKKERWYRRIWQALTRKKKDEEATVIGGGSRSGGGFMSGLGRVLGGRGPVGWVGRMAKGLLGGAAGMLGRGLSGARGLLGKAGAGLLGGAAGLLKRIPSLGGIGGALGRIAPTLMEAIPRVLGRVFGPVAAIWGAWDVGQWIGGKIHDWLVKSGLQDKLFAWVDGMRAGWSSMMDRLGKLWDDNIGKPAKKAAAAALDVAERVYDGGVDLIKGAATSFADGAAASNAWVFDKTGVDVGRGIKRLIGVEGTKRVYELSDGSTETRQGGSVSWRNNNPGNLKFGYSGSADKTVKSRRSKAQALASAQRLYEGVVDLDQYGNAIFSTPELGTAAKLKLLQKSHGGKTIEQMLPHYAVDDYSGKANHAAYASSIHKFAQSRGLDLRGKVIGAMSSSELAAVAGAMKQFEGHRIGVSSTGAAATASAPMISVPSIRNMSLVKPIGNAPDVAFPAMSGGEPPSIKLNLNEQVGQNVSDRSIAHITTGGLGGG